MARYKLTLTYDGTAFFGSQRQARRRTVQAELEKAARHLGWQGRSMPFAGRTDTGVHASGQVACLDLAWRHGEEALRDALNSKLPSDLAVVEVTAVPDAFHPRFDARSRRYVYEVRCGPVPDPLQDRFRWRIWPEPDLGILMQAGRLALGRHDFGAFGSAPGKRGPTDRTVSCSEWCGGGGTLRYEIEADAFLYRMVRRLVFVQVAVGQGRCNEDVLEQAVLSGVAVRGLPPGTAPASGLRLKEVQY